MSVIEISLQYISNGQYWILVRMCFTVSSKMRTKATYKCTSLVRHPGSVVVLTTSCLVHWNAEVPPNYGFGQGCFTGRSSLWFSSGPILVWDASPWVLDVSTLTDEKFCSSECKGRNFAGALASIFFYHEKHSLVDNGIFRGIFFQFTYAIQIFSLTLKIPDGPDSGPADPIRVQVSCPDFEKVWKLPEASRTSPRVFLRVVRIVRIPEQLSDLEKSTYFAR